MSPKSVMYRFAPESVVIATVLVASDQKNDGTFDIAAQVDVPELVFELKVDKTNLFDRCRGMEAEAGRRQQERGDEQSAAGL